MFLPIVTSLTGDQESGDNYRAARRPEGGGALQIWWAGRPCGMGKDWVGQRVLLNWKKKQFSFLGGVKKSDWLILQTD